MARFNCNGVGLVNSITDAPPPPIEIGPSTQGGTADVDKAGYSLTNGDVAGTEVDVTLVAGEPLTLVNNGGGGYTDGTNANSTALTAAENLQTGQPAGTRNFTVTWVAEGGQVISAVVGTTVGAGQHSGDTFTINGGDADNLARVMIP